MKYLKSIFESNQLNGITQKALINANLNKDQYMEMIDFIGRCGYSEVKESLPFLLKMIESDDVIGIRIYFTDFGDLSIKLGDIDRRFKRSGKKYDMSHMGSIGSGTVSGRKCIYLKIEII